MKTYPTSHTRSTRRWRIVTLPFLALAALLWVAPPFAQAAGLLIADGGFGGELDIVEHDVNVTINNGIAVTKVKQSFLNKEQRQVEALYTFPVPKGASVANFSMWINGTEMVGEVLEKKRAREIYNSYKQVRRDPGLLEQVDYKTFEMRIFPINAGATQRVEVAYYQELNVDNDRGTYVYPLATVTRPGLRSSTKGRFAIDFEVKSKVPIRSIESPSHGAEFVTAMHSDQYVQASLETDGGSLARDVVLSYDLSRPQTGIDLVTSKRGSEDGYFCLTMTVGEDLAAFDQANDYVFVMDVSGSMQHDAKLPTSRRSIHAFVDQLGVDDRFDVLAFNIRSTPLFGALRNADEVAKRESLAFLNAQQARGGTELNTAINAAYKYSDPDRTLNVVLLSDGMTEAGERRQLIELIKQRPRNARVFCIGLGNEVNKPLLQQLAEVSGGLAAFISHGDNFERQAQAFQRKLTRPVATEVAFDFGGLDVYDVEPKKPANLFHGSPIRVYGRYKGAGQPAVKVRANVVGKPFERDVALSFPRQDEANPEIERMWAWKKVDRLLKQGAGSSGVADEVVRLGEGYSIVTPFTSFLVLENDAEYRRWKIDRKNAIRIDRDRKAQAALRRELDAIRSSGTANIGPVNRKAAQPGARSSQPGQSASRPGPQAQRNPQTVSRPISVNRPDNQSWDLDFGSGSGPVGPLFIVLLAWLHRKCTRSES